MKFTLPILIACLLFGNAVVQAQVPNEGNDQNDRTALHEGISDHNVLPQNKWDYFLYPVPANDEVNIKVTRGHAIIQQVNIVDDFGNDVLQMLDLSSDKVKLNIGDLPPGQYYMQVRPDQDGPFKMKRFYVSK